MKMLMLAAGLTALTLSGAAQAAPISVQTGIVASEGSVIQVRDRSMGHGKMRGMRHGSMRGMRRCGMSHGNMRGMNHRM